jgi:hypothetical protein
MNRCRNISSKNIVHPVPVIFLILLLTLFTCGCSQVDPEELGPGESMPGPVVTPRQPGIIPPAATTPAVPTLLPRAGVPANDT